MSAIELIGTPLCQWEVGRKVQISKEISDSVTRVEFSQDGTPEALPVKTEEEGGVKVAEVPNIFLQTGKNIRAYLVYLDEQLRETKYACVLPVAPQVKPADYVYTETEVWSYKALEKRMEKLEDSLDEQVESSIEEYLKENPPGGGVEFETDSTLTLKDGILSVNTTNDMEQDNTLPITSAGVYATVGNIEALLKTI